MAKITYVGSGEDSPKTTKVFGYSFELGKATEVDNPKVVEKLSGNPCFSPAKKEAEKKEEKEPAKKEK